MKKESSTKYNNENFYDLHSPSQIIAKVEDQVSL